jgi:hypothetical protein
VVITWVLWSRREGGVRWGGGKPEARVKGSMRGFVTEQGSSRVGAWKGAPLARCNGRIMNSVCVDRLNRT